MSASAVIVLLAAGASRRMRGRDKLVEPVDGVPLLRRQAAAALATGVPVIVALSPQGAARRAVLAGLSVAPVVVADAESGMGHSLAAAARAAPPEADLLVVLADMPDIGRDEMATLLAARADHPGRVLRGADEDGRPGHPVLFPARLGPELRRLTGDEGARSLIRPEEAVLVPLPDRTALTDLDTPEAWADWHARRRKT